MRGTDAGTSEAVGEAAIAVGMVGTAAGSAIARGVSPIPPPFTDAELAELESGFCSFVGLIRVATPTPVRLATTPGAIKVLSSAYDPDNAAYMGGGRIVDIPAFQRIYNGIAERITFTFTGVTDDMRSAVYDEADDIRGAVVRLGLLITNKNNSQLGPVRWLRRGRVDQIETHNKPGPNGERIKSVAFSVGSQLTGRRVPPAGTYTNADQQARPGSEDDLGCVRTPLMVQQQIVRWPV